MEYHYDNNPELDNKISFLLSVGTAEMRHGRSNLLSHLKGTCELLGTWGARRSLCDAGLFHSVYGTERYSRASISLEFRSVVQEIIGTEAEALAYLFGIKREEVFCEQARRKAEIHQRTQGVHGNPAISDDLCRLQHRLTDEWIAVSLKQFLDLVNIAIANTLEQFPRRSIDYQTDMSDFFLCLRPLALPGAQLALDYATRGIYIR